MNLIAGGAQRNVIGIYEHAVHVGRSGLTMYIEATANDNGVASPLVRFNACAHASAEGRVCPHGLAIDTPASGVSLEQWEHVERLRN